MSLFSIPVKVFAAVLILHSHRTLFGFGSDLELEDVDEIFQLAGHHALSRLTTLGVYLSLLQNWDLLELVSRSPRLNISCTDEM
jgi:hypothetical protein